MQSLLRAPFSVDLLRLKELKSSSLQLDDDKVQNWPMVYILANDNPQRSMWVRPQVLVSVCLSIVKIRKDLFTSVNIIFSQRV